MPYITDSQKQRVDYTGEANDAGELTYQLQQVVRKYLDKHGLRFTHIAAVTGALAECARDFKERVVQPYEAKKRLENGDVWPKHMTTCLRSTVSDRWAQPNKAGTGMVVVADADHPRTGGQDEFAG